MKTILTIAVAVLLINSATGQSKKDSTAPKTDTVWVDLSKAKVIAFKDSANAKSILKTVMAIPIARYEGIAGTRQYWHRLYYFARNSKNPDFTPAQVDDLISPFEQYAKQFEEALRKSEQRPPGQ